MPKNRLIICLYILVTMNYIIPYNQLNLKAESITVVTSNTCHENCLIVGLNYEILFEGNGLFYLNC